MRILTAALLPGLSIVLAEGHDGWRFHSWSATTMRPRGAPLGDPSVDVLERRFAEHEEALAFFRGICNSPR